MKLIEFEKLRLTEKFVVAQCVEELKKEFPDAVTLSASREKLEDFFFRTVENANV